MLTLPRLLRNSYFDWAMYNPLCWDAIGDNVRIVKEHEQWLVIDTTDRERPRRFSVVEADCPNGYRFVEQR